MGCRDKEAGVHGQWTQRAVRMRELNDGLRVEHAGGRVFITEGICRLANAAITIVGSVAAFDSFAHANDPYCEHDFGSLTVLGHRVMWKIDYYDRQLQGGSPDPADASVTERVLTIMLASEY
jgi:hypothetical protein